MNQLRSLILKRSVQMIFFVIGIFCISLLAIQPFTLNQMPETADGLLQLYRTVATDYSLKVDNPLWVRYSTGIAYGYGAPLFNYFPPLSYYPASWLHSLGFAFVQSWLMMICLYTFGGAIGMFLLGRIWTQSNVGGWVTAIAYLYAPYFLFDSVARGALAEFAALAVLPFVFYGFTRLAFYGRRTDFLFAVIAFSLFVPLHTIMTLHGTAILGLYCLFLWQNADEKRHTFLRLMFAGGLALLITAFFWMPAILETDAIKLNLITEQLNHIDVTQHLRPISEILALPHTADPTQLAQSIPITLSIVQLIVSAFGLIIAWNDRNPLFRNLLLSLWLIVLVLIFLNTPTSIWIWENVPLLGYTQFPWRTLGVASLLLALMTGISIWLSWMIIPIGWIKTGVFSILTLIIVLYSIPWTYSVYLDDFELNDIRDVHTLERETHQVTLSSYSEYLPIDTDANQLDSERLVDRFEQSDVIPRLLETDELDIISEEWTSTSATLRLKSSQEQVLLFDWLYIDGWTAYVDGEPVEVNPSPLVGLVAVDVPEGEFDFSILLQPTSIQSASVVISLLGICGVIVVGVLWRHFAGFSNLHSFQLDPEIQIFVIVVTVGLGVFLFKAIVLDRTDTQFKSTRYGDLAAENNEIVPLANFGNQIDLLDVEMPENAISGHFVEIMLYWKLHDSYIDTDYSSIVRMLDPQGIVIAEFSSFEIGGLATSNWLPNTYIVDAIGFDVPEFVPALTDGYQYTLEVSLYDAESLTELSVINTSGNPESVTYQFSTVNIHEKYRYEGTRVKPRNYINLGNEYAGMYQDIPVTGLPTTATVGEELTFSWTWQQIEHPTHRNKDDVFARLAWIDEANNGEYYSKFVPLVFGYPNYLWRKNEVVTSQHRLYVPPPIPAGAYEVGIQVVDVEGMPLTDVYLINHQMTINEPDRTLERPSMDYDFSAFWDNGIRMLGYNVDTSGQVQILWQADDLQEKSLRLFVHVLDGDDLIVAQSDGVPVNWTRPLTSWIPEEYVMTTHNFDLPSGEYRIRLGWYDPLTDERINLTIGGDSIVLEDNLIIN